MRISDWSSDVCSSDLGTTPLMLATQLRFLDGVQLLLANGAQVDKANDRGETPLIRAVQLHDLAMVRFLIANGANPDKADTLAGMSALDYAKRSEEHTSELQSLMRNSYAVFCLKKKKNT